MPEAAYGTSNCWLTCVTIDPLAAGLDRESVRLRLERVNVEARPVWKPMHLQPVFSGCRVRGGSVSESLFEHGLCLPSGSSLTAQETAKVVREIRSAFAESSLVSSRIDPSVLEQFENAGREPGRRVGRVA